MCIRDRVTAGLTEKVHATAFMTNVGCGLSISETTDQHRPVRYLGLYGCTLLRVFGEISTLQKRPVRSSGKAVISTIFPEEC